MEDYLNIPMLAPFLEIRMDFFSVKSEIWVWLQKMSFCPVLLLEKATESFPLKHGFPGTQKDPSVSLSSLSRLLV